MKKGSVQIKRRRDLEQSRKEILGVAFLEVYQKGFQGVSVDDIVKKTKLTKGAFYHQFPTKMDLGYALVDEMIKPMIIERWIDPLASFQNPLKGILFQIKKLIGGASKEELQYGCPLNNLIQEMSPVDQGFKIRLKAALNHWIDEMEKEILRAKKEGFLKENVNPKQVACFIVMIHEGFYGILKGLDNPKSFSVLYNSLREYFKTIEA